MAVRIWIDTDIGSDVDDALTLGYVLRHAGFELAGVSTVFGDVELRSDITRALLEVAEEDDVPVLSGLGVPLTEGRAGVMFGHEGKGILEACSPRMRTEEENGGEARIERIAEALHRADPDILLAIGPLSNLGALVKAGAELPPLAIMGGKFTDALLPGMIQGISEWNWFSDPVAAQAVLEADHDSLPRVVPAEVTFQTALEEGDVEKLSEGDALARQRAALCTHWLDFLRPHAGHGKPRVALHDPLTAAILVENGLCNFTERRVRLDEKAAAEIEPGEPNLLAATDVDVKALRDHLMATWL